MATPISRHYTRFVPSEEVGEVTAWHFGSVGRPGEPEHGPQAPPPPEPLPQEEEALIGGVPEAEHLTLVAQAGEHGFTKGVEQGLAQGHAQGYEQATQEWQQRLDDYIAGQGAEAAQQLAEVARKFEDSLGALQQDMAQQVLALACDIARQVVRREVVGNSRAMLPVVREALDMLTKEGSPATVRLHPADWTLLERALRSEFGGGRIQWQPDTTLAPGDCLVESGGAVVDGRLEQRWRRAIDALGLTAAWREEVDYEHAD